MIPQLIETGLKLAGLLAEENKLLSAMDLAAAAALNPRKQAAVEGYVAARDKARTSPPPPPPERQALVKLAERLSELARHNRALLERGLAAQAQLIETVAGIATRPAPGYVPPPGAARPPAFALNARA